MNSLSNSFLKRVLISSETKFRKFQKKLKNSGVWRRSSMVLSKSSKSLKFRQSLTPRLQLRFSKRLTILLRFWMIIWIHFWWWKALLTLSRLSPEPTTLKRKLSWFKTLFKIGLRLREVGCIWNQSFRRKTSSKRCLWKSKNLSKSINTGNKLSNTLQRKRTSGTTLTLKSTRPSLKIATDCLTKSKRVFQNILKQRGKTSQGFTFFLTRNCLKFWLKPKTLKLSKDTSTNVSKASGSWKWAKELSQEWFRWKNSKLIFRKGSMSMKAKRRVTWKNGFLKSKEWWFKLSKKSPSQQLKTSRKELIGSENGLHRPFSGSTWSDGQQKPSKPSAMAESSNLWQNSSRNWNKLSSLSEPI